MVDVTAYVSVVEHSHLLIVVIARDRVDRHFISLLHRNSSLLLLLCSGTLRLLDLLLVQALDRLCKISFVCSQCLGKLV